MRIADALPGRVARGDVLCTTVAYRRGRRGLFRRRQPPLRGGRGRRAAQPNSEGTCHYGLNLARQPLPLANGVFDRAPGRNVNSFAFRRKITGPGPWPRPDSISYPCTGIPSGSLLGTFRPLLNSKHGEVIGPNLVACKRFGVRSGSENLVSNSLLGSECPAISQQAARARRPG